MLEFGEKESNYLFKSYTGSEQWPNIILKNLKVPYNTHKYT